MSYGVYENLPDAFFARKHRPIVEAFFDAQFVEPDFGHQPLIAW